MDDAGMCAGIRPLRGVYLTGAIAPADRAVAVRHLAACADCRAELAGLAGLPALLRRPPVYAAAQALERDAPPPESTGPESTGPEGTALDSAALDSTGPDSTVLEYTVPKYAVPGAAGAAGIAAPGRLVRRIMRRRRRRRWLLATAAFVLAAGAGVGWA